MKNRFLVFSLFFAITLSSKAQGYLVISNKENKISVISESELRSIFLGEKFYWSSTVKIRPARLGDSNNANLTFIQNTLKMKLDDFLTSWRNRLFSGRAIPPRKFESDLELLSYVKSTSGSIGIASSNNKNLMADVDILEVK